MANAYLYADLTEADLALDAALREGDPREQRARTAQALGAGARIDTPWMSDGCTLLMLASVCGHTTQVELLCELGANVHLRDERGATALWLAAVEHGQHQRAMEILLAHGADPRTCGPGGADLGEKLAAMAEQSSDYFKSLPERRAIIERWMLATQTLAPSAKAGPKRM